MPRPSGVPEAVVTTAPTETMEYSMELASPSSQPVSPSKLKAKLAA